MSLRNLKLATGVMLVSLLFTGLALSHGNLQSAKPKPGETVSQSPSTIELTFNEPIQSGTITLVQTGGNAVSVTPVKTTSPDILAVEVDETLADGEYNVLWMVTSQDNHIINGSYSFEVNAQKEDFPDTRVIIGGIGLIGLLVGGWIFLRGRAGSTHIS